MAWTLRGEAKAEAATAATTMSTEDNGGAQDGDLMVLFAVSDIDPATLAVTAGGATWNAFTGNPISNAYEGAAWYKVAASEPATYEITGGSSNMGAVLLVFNPGGATITVDATATNESVGVTTVHSSPSVTVVAGVDSVGLFVAGWTNDSQVGVTTAPSGMTAAAVTMAIGALELRAYYDLARAAGAASESITWTSGDTNGAQALAAHLTAAAGGAFGGLAGRGGLAGPGGLAGFGGGLAGFIKIGNIYKPKRWLWTPRGLAPQGA